MHDQAHEERPPSTSPGWYPDRATGGTAYWDGERWTGDARPPRRYFAAQAGHEEWWAWFGFGCVFFFASFFASALNDGSVSTFGLWAVFFLIGLSGIVGGIYMKRGQGPTTQEVETRLSEQRKDAKKKRRTANVAGAFATLGRTVAPSPPATPGAHAAEAAQIDALANPQTAQALQDLRNLLYTRALTDQEYQAAKDKLLGTLKPDDSFAQIEKLSELHRQGILGDVEFSAAKARVLGY